jgi:hypothetical protein
MNAETIRLIDEKVEEDLAMITRIVEEDDPRVEIQDETLVGSWFIGSVLTLSPSEKYYMPWTSNQTAEDTAQDELYWNRLTARIDEEFGEGWGLTQGEGDPLDVFLQVSLAEGPWTSLWYEEEQELLSCLDGGYPIGYLTKEGDILCAECATNALLNRDNTLEGIHTNFEDPSLFCSQCGAQIEPAYKEEE